MHSGPSEHLVTSPETIYNAKLAAIDSHGVQTKKFSFINLKHFILHDCQSKYTERKAFQIEFLSYVYRNQDLTYFIKVRAKRDTIVETESRSKT